MAEYVNAVANIRKKAINVVESLGHVVKDENGEYPFYQDPIMMIAYIDKDLVAIGQANPETKEYDVVYLWSDLEQQIKAFVLELDWVEYLEVLELSTLIKKK